MAWLVPQALPVVMAMCPAASATARGQRGAPRWPNAGPRHVGSHQGHQSAVPNMRLMLPLICWSALGGGWWMAAL
eukprot:1760335-Prorocentrum_lima.AAC.1